ESTVGFPAVDFRANPGGEGQRDKNSKKLNIHHDFGVLVGAFDKSPDYQIALRDLFRLEGAAKVCKALEFLSDCFQFGEQLFLCGEPLVKFCPCFFWCHGASAPSPKKFLSVNMPMVASRPVLETTV